jgi:hypothetical protein
MAFDSLRAIEFVRSIDLTGTPLGTSTARATGTRDILEPAALDAGGVFDKAKAQAQVVGAGVFSFAQGVTPEVRQAISDSALLAQLHANKSVSAQNQPLEWFAAYFDVLQKIGWIVQESTWNDYTAKGAAVEVHAKILEVMTAALGPSAAALAVIGATIDALKGMNPRSPWMTIFNRESQKARIARFQIGLVEHEENSDVVVSLLACLIEAHNDITQVLFFKFKNAGATFRANSGKVSINRPRLSELSPFIVDQIRAYQTNYLSTILNL